MKKAILFFIIILVFSFSATFASSGDSIESDYNDGYNDGYNAGYREGQDDSVGKNPVVRIEEVTKIREINAGDTFVFEVTFINDSKYNAKDVVITPQVEDCSALVYDRPIVYRMKESLKANKSKTVEFTLTCNENTKKGTYGLKFKIDYKNYLDKTFSKEYSAFFKVVKEKTRPFISISNIEISNQNLKYGDSFNASFDIENIGGNVAKDVEVTLSGFANSAIMPVDSNDYSYVGNLQVNNKKSFNFPMIISQNIETEDNTIKITVSYKDNQDKEYTVTKNIYVVGVECKEKNSGDKKDEDKLPKPKIIISRYSLSNNSIIAGEDFSFIFNFTNTSKEKDIRNIKITISPVEGSFIITKGSNTFFIENMDRSSSLTRQIDLKPKQDLASNSYAIIIKFEFEDYDGRDYSSEETINIPVTEYSKLVINSAIIEEAYVNTYGNLSFEYVNMGKATISNLMATVTGDFKSKQENTYIGNVVAGSSDMYDVEIMPTKIGLNKGTLILSFEDSARRKIEVTRNFEVNAMEEIVMPDIDFIIDNSSEENNDVTHFETWQIVLSGIGSFLLTFLITKTITKKIILKKFEDEM